MPQAIDLPPLTDGIDLLLGQFGNGAGRLLLIAGQIEDLIADLLKIPKHLLFPDDLGIIFHIGRSGCHIDQLQKIGPVGFVLIAQGLHFLQHCYRVDPLSPGEHAADGIEDHPIGFNIKIIGLEQLHHFGHASGIKQNCSDDRLLGLHTVGGLPGQKLIHGQNPLLRQFCSSTTTFTVPTTSG